MAVKSILTSQTDFSGEIPVNPNTASLWHINEYSGDDTAPTLVDASGHDRNLHITNWIGTSAGFPNGRYGRCFRFNLTNPTSEKTFLTCANDGTIWNVLGDRIAVGGWIQPTTYSIGQTYVPIFNTRQGPGQPIFYLSLMSGKPRMMIYNSAGALILDQQESGAPNIANGEWYFLAAVIDVTAKTSQMILCARSDGNIYTAPLRSFTGIVNPDCVADIVIGMHANQYYFSGGVDDWFLEKNTATTIDDLKNYFYNARMANGGDTSGTVDALKYPGSAVLRADSSNNYPSSGVLITRAAQCALSGVGRVAISSQYSPGSTAVSLIETSTSDDLITWSDWLAIGANGDLNSPNMEYIRYRVTLTSNDPAATPVLLDITLHDSPVSVYDSLGFARPVVLSDVGAREAVLESAYDIIVTKEINGIDILEFKIPYNDIKRSFIGNEKQIQIADDIYRVRSITDERESGGGIVSFVYAEASFYDLGYGIKKESRDFEATTPETEMDYALQNTDWSRGDVNVSTRRTWRSEEKNPLAIIREIQRIHGGDLTFDNKNKIIGLLTFSGSDSGAVFAYRKNLLSVKRVVDTRSLITRLYAFGKDGLTFANINNGKEYLEDFTFTNEVRTSSLDLSNFTNPYQMLDFTAMRLADYSRPRVSYVISVIDLSALTGYDHEKWRVGDIVTVNDEDLDITLKTRIMRMEYNVQEPWKTVIELSTSLRELGSAVSDTIADQLSQSAFLQQEVKDLVPFNHLRNSRADDGFAYWQNSGFEVDTTGGASGSASFKAAGVADATKSMAQTVYPANRKNYTISAQIASENLVKNADTKIGFELVFEFEDGSTETRFLDLF